MQVAKILQLSFSFGVTKTIIDIWKHLHKYENFFYKITKAKASILSSYNLNLMVNCQDKHLDFRIIKRIDSIPWKIFVNKLLEDFHNHNLANLCITFIVNF